MIEIAQPVKRGGGCYMMARLSLIMNSVLSLTGAAHRYRRKDSAAEIRAGER
jgi:hypothetical protein